MDKHYICDCCDRIFTEADFSNDLTDSFDEEVTLTQEETRDIILHEPERPGYFVPSTCADCRQALGYDGFDDLDFKRGPIIH